MKFKFYRALTLLSVIACLNPGNLFAQLCPLTGSLTVSPATGAISCNGVANVSVAATQTNVVYYLRNDANNAIVASAAGTGGTIVLNTGNMNAATTFNVNSVATTGGLTFSGYAQQVLISSPHSSTGNFTWETWFKANGDGTLFSIASPSGSYATSGSKILYITGGLISFDAYGYGSLQTAGNAYTDNKWHHVAFTVQSNFSSNLERISIYADGVLAAQTLFDMNTVAETGLVNKIGFCTSDASNSLPGTVDEVRIWNTTRTAAEVVADMSNCLTGTETGLVGYYKFENGTGSTTVTDIAGGNNNGALMNMNAATAWTAGRDNCGACSQQQAIKPAFTITGLTNQAITPAASTVICNGGVAVTFSTQTGVNYYLRNDANNAVLSGPIAGTGGTVALGSGNITASSTLNVLGKKLSGALTFDGVDDRVTIPYSPAYTFSTNVDFTYEAMIKFTVGQADYAGIISKNTNGSPFSQLIIVNNTIAAEVFTSYGSVGVTEGLAGTTLLNDGKWHHVAMVVTRATNNVKLYVDGMVEANVTNAYIGGNLDEITGFNIGSDRTASYFFNGTIDEARIWNTARSVSQLTVNASTCLTGSETGLVAYYPFEDGTNSLLAADLTNNHRTGFLLYMNTATAWTTGLENCSSCSLQMSVKPTIVVKAIANQSLTAALPNICGSGSTTINSAGSEANINYYLRDNSTNTVVTGPIVGTGSALSFTTGNITSTKTYNVLAKKISGGLTFDGVDDYITTPLVPAFNFAGNFAMEAWIWSPVGANPGTKVIIGMPGSSDCWLGFTNTGFPTFTSGGSLLTGTTAVNDGLWHHIAGVKQSGVKYLYVDGILLTTEVNNVAVSLNSDIEIGGYNGGYNFEGRIDEIRIFNSALTQTQVAASMTACATGSETGLLLSYNFEDGRGSTTVTDLAGMDNNGTLTNMAVTTAWANGVETCGCTLQMTNTPIVTINAKPTISANSATICSGASVVVTPTGAATYTITGGTFTVTPGTTTSYSVTGTGSNNCTASNTAVISVSVNASPILSVNSATICSGNSVTIVPTGAATYTITGGTFTVSPNVSTSYSITGTGANNCVASNPIVSTISVNATPTLAVNNATICSGNSVAIVPTGAATYTITGGAFTVSPNVSTSYSITGTGTNNCVASNPIVSTVFVNATPTLAVNSATICSGNSVAIVPTGAATYTITGGAFTVSPNVSTSYSITGTGANNCVASNPIVSTVFVNATPTLAVNSATICSGNSVAIVPTGAATYTITGGAFTVSPNVSTSYSITGTGANNCVSSNTIVSTVFVNATPTLAVNNATICSGSSVVIVPSGASTYTISGNTFTVNPLSNSSYSVTGTSANGCISSAAVSSVSVNALPLVTASTSNATVCVNSTATLTAGGAVSYSWSNAQTTAMVVLTPTVAGSQTYTVSGTGANGCIGTAMVTQVADNCTSVKTITDSRLIFTVYPNPNTGQFTVETGENVQITVLNSIGQTVHTETTSDTKTNISIENLASGIYFIRVTANGNQHTVKMVKD